MKTYRYTIPNTVSLFKLINLSERPCIGELIVPNPLDKHKIYLKVIQIIHEANAEPFNPGSPLLIVTPFDWKEYKAVLEKENEDYGGWDASFNFTTHDGHL